MGHTTITLTGIGLQDAQALDITISIIATINIDAKTARRRVTAWLVSEVGNMLIGGPPQLVIGRETVWRVPVVLTSSRMGTVGEMGTIDVDGENGALLVSDDLRDRILDYVKQFSGPTLSPTN